MDEAGRSRTDWVEYRWMGFVAVFAAGSGAALAFGGELRTSLLLGFDLATALFLFALALAMARGGAARLREQSARVDAGRWVVLMMTVLLSSAALVALGIEIQAAHKAAWPQILLAAVSIVLAWLLMNTMFALHYAHSFYADANVPGGSAALDFPGTGMPDYFDFLYFALVLGMTFQVSDVTIVSSKLRRVALAHAVIAFFFNVVVLALSVSLLGTMV